MIFKANAMVVQRSGPTLDASSLVHDLSDLSWFFVNWCNCTVACSTCPFNPPSSINHVYSQHVLRLRSTIPSQSFPGRLRQRHYNTRRGSLPTSIIATAFFRRLVVDRYIFTAGLRIKWRWLRRESVLQASRRRQGSSRCKIRDSFSARNGEFSNV